MKDQTADIFQRVTDQIVNAIECGAGAFKLPWRTSAQFLHSPINAANRIPYRGINILILWAIAQEKRYTTGRWATFKQWQELGAQVRKGEKAAHIVFWKFLDKSEEHSETEERQIPMARHYWVFNQDQVDGFTPENEPEPAPVQARIEHAENFFGTLGIKPRAGGNHAFYSLDEDAIYMPAFEAFGEPLRYYSALCHETTHWSAAPHRLNRDLKGRFGSEAYAMEELVAELGAAFLCSKLCLPTDPRTDHAPYIATWLKVLKNDKRAIFSAAAKAQEAADWLFTKATTKQMEAA